VGANDAFEKALELEPSNAQAKSGLDAVKRAMQSQAGNDPLGGLGTVFKDPMLFQKLASNPKTSPLIADPSFMATMQQIQQNPSTIMQHIGDQRVLQAMSVLMGLPDMSGATTSEEAPKATEAEEEIPAPGAAASASASSNARASEPEPMEVDQEPEDEDAISKKKAKEEADKEKALGTENYRKRQFDAAIEHYTKAWELHKDITYLTNLGAAKFEKGDYEGAIEACKQAIEYGREILADFKLIAK
jgi:stress-induced-phosphoprotein 1